VSVVISVERPTCVSTLAGIASCTTCGDVSPEEAGTHTETIFLRITLEDAADRCSDGNGHSTVLRMRGHFGNCDFQSGTANLALRSRNSSSSWVVDLGASGLMRRTSRNAFQFHLGGNIEFYQDNLSCGANGTPPPGDVQSQYRRGPTIANCFWQLNPAVRSRGFGIGVWSVANPHSGLAIPTPMRFTVATSRGGQISGRITFPAADNTTASFRRHPKSYALTSNQLGCRDV